jgi:hypothetical protein
VCVRCCLLCGASTARRPRPGRSDVQNLDQVVPGVQISPARVMPTVLGVILAVRSGKPYPGEVTQRWLVVAGGRWRTTRATHEPYPGLNSSGRHGAAPSRTDPADADLVNPGGRAIPAPWGRAPVWRGVAHCRTVIRDSSLWETRGISPALLPPSPAMDPPTRVREPRSPRGVSQLPSANPAGGNGACLGRRQYSPE